MLCISNIFEGKSATCIAKHCSSFWTCTPCRRSRRSAVSVLYKRSWRYTMPQRLFRTGCQVSSSDRYSNCNASRSNIIRTFQGSRRERAYEGCASERQILLYSKLTELTVSCFISHSRPALFLFLACPYVGSKMRGFIVSPPVCNRMYCLCSSSCSCSCSLFHNSFVSRLVQYQTIILAVCFANSSMFRGSAIGQFFKFLSMYQCFSTAELAMEQIHYNKYLSRANIQLPLLANLHLNA